MSRSSTETLVSAMRILARDVQSSDGVANAAIAEAADRLEDLEAECKRLREGLSREEVEDEREAAAGAEWLTRAMKGEGDGE